MVGILNEDIHYVYDENIQLLNKRTKSLHLYCALPFWKCCPFHYISFDPYSLVRPTEQVEFSHFEATERTSDLPKATDTLGQNPPYPIPVQSLESCLLQGATGKRLQFCPN